MITEIQNIIDSNKTVSEKEKALRKLEEEFKKELNDARNKIQSGYLYCPLCKDYYRENTFETKIIHEKRNVCTFWPLAEFDDPKYENKDCIITLKICPKGHKNEEDIKW